MTADTKCTAPNCECDWPVCRKEAGTKFKRSDFVGKFSVKNIGIREGDKLMTEPTKDELLNELKRYETYNEQYHMRSNDVILYALRLAANLPSEDKIATTICQSGRFETGEGVCAAICMDQLGNPRNSGCRHAKIVHKRLAARILERIRSVK